MEMKIDANTPLDYIEFHIFPSRNRYDASVWYANKKEKVMSGLLENLLLHSEEVKALHLEGSSAKYKLSPPENLQDIKWFTKSTLIRFLHVISSADKLDPTNSLKTEISQLEEARSQLSLYAKGTEYQFQSGESDSSYSNGLGSTPNAEGSDSSKNELLQAMDLRLAALERELNTAFDQAVGSSYSVEDMSDLQKFSHHFGSGDLRDLLCKLIEFRQGTQVAETSNSEQLSASDRVISKEGTNDNTKLLSSQTQVKYGASPAKVAQVERQSSDSDQSSSFSEEEQQSVERSRSLVRSASPRRSASPMRRIQIGRSGSRRATAVSIKSLNYFPAREKSFLPKDPGLDDSDEEGYEPAPKKSESNVRRMSVQDAINLFESKQKDQAVDTEKTRLSSNASVGAKKSVLRRWSSGMGEEDSPGCPQASFSAGAAGQIHNNMESKEPDISPEAEAEHGVASEDHNMEHQALDAELDLPEKKACGREVMLEESLPTETPGNRKLSASAEWTRQKEAELDELLMKMKKTKPMKSQIGLPANAEKQSLPPGQRGGLYDHYKEKRDRKLQGESVSKKAGKDKQLAMQKDHDAKKLKLTSANISDTSKKDTSKKLQKQQKSVSKPPSPKPEAAMLSVFKKVSPNTSSLPATRKSWPSMPSSRASGLSTGKTTAATSSTGARATHRRSQPTPQVSHPSPKLETSEMRKKSVKLDQDDSKKRPGGAAEKKLQMATRPSKTVKSKVQTAPEDLASAAKPGLYRMVTKKSSVVPLESKPFLRKGSGTISNVNPTAKKKAHTVPQEPLRKSEDPTLSEENETVSESPKQEIQHEERKVGESKVDMDMEPRTSTESIKKYGDKSDFSQVNLDTDVGIDRVVKPELKSDAEEESTISPTAWVEIEEHEDRPVTSNDHIYKVLGSPAHIALVKEASPRVRHSLSQMLLQESTEPDIIDWGNAENPPMICHKDSPKGLKRLLKFGRKSRTEANTTGWSSPSVFSEGEDEAEDPKYLNRSSAENLLMKAKLHSSGNQKNVTDYEHPAQANMRKMNAPSLPQQFQEGHVSASVSTAKATRSFFSLSAFKGSK